MRVYTYIVNTCLSVLMRDEMEERRKQARSNKQQGKAYMYIIDVQAAQ